MSTHIAQVFAHILAPADDWVTEDRGRRGAMRKKYAVTFSDTCIGGTHSYSHWVRECRVLSAAVGW